MSNIDLSNLGSAGFSITGEASSASGRSVRGAGDINGDGINDVIIGAPNLGKSYVVYGKAGGGDVADVDLSNLGTAGFVITGETNTASGTAVNSAGDINGDGRGDIIIGAPNFNSGAGKSYVIYGQDGGIDITDIDLSNFRYFRVFYYRRSQ